MDTVGAGRNLIFMTDISGYDSSYSFLSEKDPLTSTPTKVSKENSEEAGLSPIPPSFMLLDEPSIELSTASPGQSLLESNHSEINKDSPLDLSPGESYQWMHISTTVI